MPGAVAGGTSPNLVGLTVTEGIERCLNPELRPTTNMVDIPNPKLYTDTEEQPIKAYLLSVRVPVLSEQSTSIPDNSSNADNLQNASTIIHLL